MHDLNIDILVCASIGIHHIFVLCFLCFKILLHFSGFKRFCLGFFGPLRHLRDLVLTSFVENFKAVPLLFMSRNIFLESIDSFLILMSQSTVQLVIRPILFNDLLSILSLLTDQSVELIYLFCVLEMCVKELVLKEGLLVQEQLTDFLQTWRHRGIIEFYRQKLKILEKELLILMKSSLLILWIQRKNCESLLTFSSSSTSLPFKSFSILFSNRR